MNPAIFTILSQNLNVQTVLGANPCRVYPFGRAPEKVTKPYVTYGIFNVNPQNYLANRCDSDNVGNQINIWGESVESVNACFEAIRTALEGYGYLTNYTAADKDSETGLYGSRMEYDIWVSR